MHYTGLKNPKTMQNKGAIKFLAIALAVACAFQLSFTFVTGHVRNQAEKISEGDAAREAAYLDSMKPQVVYNLGFVKYTYEQCLEKELNLGLDLRGGMNITLEIGIGDMLHTLSGNSTDPDFNRAIREATQTQRTSSGEFITLFEQAYNRIAPQGQLSAIFAGYVRDKKINNATNDAIIKALRADADAAIQNSQAILSSRIDRFGVMQPSIQRVPGTGRILVELPGVKEPERVRKLLQGTANLQFWTTYTANDIYPAMMEADRVIAALNASAQDTTASDTTATADLESRIATAQEELANAQASMNERIGGNSLFGLLSPANHNSPVIGMAQAFDTAKVMAYLNLPQVKSLFPMYTKFMWGVKGIKENTNVYELYAIKGNAKNEPALGGEVITNAVGQQSQQGSRAEVSMSMNSKGALAWKNLTGQNVGKYIAVVLDNVVYSCPVVNGEIAGGNSQISGDFTIAEAKDLASILNSGKLDAPAHVIASNVVGPSLGQESVNDGVTSFIIAFALVLIYMLFFYSTAGFVANIALLANLFFLFGVLVSFGAVLTLPGIAGIVLTMGMAVDANVIIYERVKEEIHAGKGLSLSITDGFKNAYSAIIDGNATTLITGIVLFIFGSGPVQGFATTLIIGILTSLFCAIFITRLIFTAMLTKGKNIKFWSKPTEHFLANTKFDFVGARKYTYIVSVILMAVCAISLATRGLSYGVDFTGGRAYVVRFDNAVTANDVREQLNLTFPEEPEVKQFGTKDQMQMRIVTQYKHADDADGVDEEINEMLYTALSPLYKASLTPDEFFTTATSPMGIISSERVGASIAHDIKINSVIAVIFSLLAIGIYIAIRFKNWQYGMGGVVSLLHDAVLTIGLFSLFYGVLPFNLTVDQSFIAAILTIIGYSINDTVVIFDRIRENHMLHPRFTHRENINNAINATLARTVNTCGSTIIVLLAIFLFGGEVIAGFVFALLFGITIGTFSSVFVATPVAYDLMMRKEKKDAEKAKAELKEAKNA